MDSFRIELAPAASRDLDEFEIRVVERVLSDLKVLEKNPFPRGKLIKKLKGKKFSLYRLMVDKFRVFYEIQPGEVIVLRVLSKKDSDRFIKRL